MPVFGSASKKRKLTVDVKLQEILDTAIEVFDFAIVCGHRGKSGQDVVFNAGKS